LKVFIAENSPIICARLVTILSEIDGIFLVGFAHSVSQAMPVITASRPDVVLIGSHFPRNNAARLLALIRKAYPDMVVIMLTDHPAEIVKEYTNAGAHFRFDKATELEALVRTLITIAAATR
jgi:DNA-binding NarL/FixJ family response regulator